MHLHRTLFNIYLLASVSLAVPTVGPLLHRVSSATQEFQKRDPLVGPSGSETCCLYERKLKRRDGEAPEHYYPEGADNIPKGTSPNKILPRHILKREDDYDCICATLYGSCSVACGDCKVTCDGPCVATCPSTKTKQKKKRDPNFGPDSDLSSAPQDIEKKRDASPDSELSGTAGPEGLSHCCEYEQKRKRSADPPSEPFYPEGGNHVPPGTSPNKILPREILNREDDYTCICFSIFNQCSVNCGVGGQNSSGGGKKK